MRKHRNHILLKRAKKLWRRKIKSKLKRKKTRKEIIGLNESDRIINKLKNNFEYTKVKAPKNLSFVENTNDFVGFINKLSACLNKQRKVFVVLKNVEEITYDAIVVLLSLMVKFKSKKIIFNGDFPKNKKAFDLLTKSGFFEYLYINDFKLSDKYDLPAKSGIHIHAMKIVDSVLGDKIISSATKTIRGEKRRCQGVQKTFLELMMNTNNHADIHSEGVSHWWLSVFHVKEEKKVVFSFVDYGVGIFNSLDNKTDRSKWYGWMQRLASKFKFSNNAEVLKLILDGQLHRTITNESYRGNGLPGSKLSLVRNQISNLHIITNNVRANVKNDSYEIINQNFSGTFVFWELNETNISCNGTN